ncbi:MopE-related protein [Polyangium aurulentum]|uniref:MopE-related protein n=1 Tax=Polyangium aurulentum TaxID=2567896 RepID=UPI0010AE7275|nr:MopE-related protein [Polyangium aurulentum]UQA57589.1 hypothetical protein E8A73_040970 [Polyangium aurulentum]
MLRIGLWRVLVLLIGASLSGAALGCVATDGETSSANLNPGAGGGGGEGGFGQGGSGGATCVPAAETCDGMDNDCNGGVDEGCACQEGQSQPCYSGPAQTKNVGACAEGAQLCDAKGQWGPCIGQVKPITDTCNGIDDDCDGAVDDLPEVACGVGACHVVVPGCVNGKAPVCEPLLPSLEVCDGVDNDCDQLVDEFDPGVGKGCDTGEPGVCNAGKKACVAGAIVCTTQVTPSNEVCDELDNDCNGAVDDVLGTGGECSTGLLGICSAGTTACVGNGIDCVQTLQPQSELCNGIDDDCDGQLDEGNPEGGGACPSGQAGACAFGVYKCMGGQLICEAGSGGAEICNGKDDDCDGVADNGNPGGGTCDTGQLGLCGVGSQDCVNGKLVCSQPNQPVAEVCGDKLDNDCDGTTDEGCCAHPLCTTGGTLTPSCDPCVAKVCASDSYCCNSGWDSICVGEVTSICGLTCP